MICMDSGRWVQGSKSGSIRCAYNLQVFSPIFSFGLDGHKFGSGKYIILGHHGMIYRQLPVIEKAASVKSERRCIIRRATSDLSRAKACL